MSREATSFEGYVRCLEIEGEEIWASVQMIQPKVEINNDALPSGVVSGLNQCAQAEREPYFSCYLKASELPGIKIGDKVQIALYLK